MSALRFWLLTRFSAHNSLYSVFACQASSGKNLSWTKIYLRAEHDLRTVLQVVRSSATSKSEASCDGRLFVIEKRESQDEEGGRFFDVRLENAEDSAVFFVLSVRRSKMEILWLWESKDRSIFPSSFKKYIFVEFALLVFVFCSIFNLSFVKFQDRYPSIFHIERSEIDI